MLDESLLNSRVITERLLVDAPWAKGHGASEGNLGPGLFYYCIPYVIKARLCVCIGSGGGFVPRMMRQAQRDLGLGSDGLTHLIDANLPSVGWGAPKWIENDSFFRANYPEIEVHLIKSKDAASLFHNETIDYLHIDADHSYEGCRSDFELFSPFVRADGIITLHDSQWHREDSRCGVYQVVDEIRQNKSYDVIDFPSFGVGLAMVRKCE
jgi:hypothetical protein